MAANGYVVVLPNRRGLPWFRKRMERRDFWRLDRPVHERLSFSY